MVSEKRILAEGLLAIQAPDLLAWRNNTGQAWQGVRVMAPIGGVVRITPGMVVLKDARPVSFGLLGSADILGVAPGFGFALEAKARAVGSRTSRRSFRRHSNAPGGATGCFVRPRKPSR
jgi:hypothetical protein